MEDKKYYRPDELAHRIEQPTWLVLRWIRQQHIKHVHFGKKISIPKEEVDRITREGIKL
jgi:excisionase family DNA binding protein